MRTELVSPLKCGMHTAASASINTDIAQSSAGIAFSVNFVLIFSLFVCDAATAANTPIAARISASPSETAFSAAGIPTINGEIPLASAPNIANIPARV